MSNIKIGVIWTSGEKLLIQLVQFIIGIIIARLISPQEYGVLGIIMVFINVAEVFVDSGMGSALIYRNNLDKKDTQTTFSFNLIVSLIFYIFLFHTSIFIEEFFQLNKLAVYLKVASLVIVFNSFVIVPTSILKVKHNFKAISLANITSTIFGGVIGVFMAYSGYGVWALICQLLSRSILSVIFINVQCRWLPHFSFYKESFKGLWKYSANLLTLNSLTKFVEEGLTFIIGKSLTPYNLGLFTRGLQFSSLPNGVISSVLSTVMFPVLSSFRNDESLFYTTYRKTIILQSIFIPPIYLGLVIISEPLVYLLLGEKWMGVVPILQILCLGKLLFTFGNTTENVLYSLGHTHISLKQQMYKMLVKLLLVLFALKWGFIAVVIANAFADFSAFFITNYCGRKYLVYSIKKQLNDIYSFIIAAFFSGGLGYLVGLFISSPILNIIVVVTISLIVYILLLYLIIKLRNKY